MPIGDSSFSFTAFSPEGKCTDLALLIIGANEDELDVDLSDNFSSNFVLESSLLLVTVIDISSMELCLRDVLRFILFSDLPYTECVC